MKVTTRLTVVALACVLALLLHVAAEEAPHAPFQIPPEGKPELLIGGIDLEAPSALAFDSRNRPYMFHTREPESYGYILTLRDGAWKRLSYLEALRKAVPNLAAPKGRDFYAMGTITIDDSDALYAVVPAWKRDGKRSKAIYPSEYALLYSADRGRTFHAYQLDVKRAWEAGAWGAFLEVRVGHNNLSAPPVIGLVRFRKKYPKQGVNFRYARYYDLYVLVPEKKDNRLVLGDPIHVTSDCFGCCNHSGGYSFAVTTGRKAHVVYADIPKKPNGGNPTFVATIDRQKRRVLSKRFIATALPKTPDVHSTPVIAADAKGFLHVVCGSHNNTFLYSRSLKPDDIEAGWTKPAAMSHKQTYATLVCDGKDRLHSVYRVHPRLLYQSKPASSDKWSSPVELVRAPTGHKYTIFYHRLFIDRAGALYLSFTFFDFKTAGRGRYPRALAVSEDRGKTWRLATTKTFIRRKFAKPADADKPHR